ncbi:DNA ligase, NAD-dependent, partial [human gut metagenome]
MITKEELEKYQIAYSQGSPLIDDSTYDNLLEEYVNQHGEESRPFTRQKQSSSVNDIVGTIPKTYGVTKPMREGQKIYSDWVRLNGLTHNDWIYLQCKFDGCSVAYDCKTQRFFTRGDYDNGESVDVTELFSDRIGSDEYRKYWDADYFDAVKFEAIIHPSVFYEMKLNEQYKRPRDMVSATITSRNVEMAKYITLVPLRKYLNGKQYICHNIGMYLPCDAYEEIEKFISDVLGNNASSLFQPYEGYACDGVVATVVTNDTDEELSTEVIPGKEVAIKILNNIKETTLKNVDFQFGRSGRITPV